MVSATFFVFAATGASHAANSYCAEKIKEMCGKTTVTKCFVYSSSWQSMDSNCLDEVERLIAREAKKRK